MPSHRRPSIAFTVTVSVLVGICALFMLGLLMGAGAPGIMVLATVLAAVPVVPLVLAYLWLDRYEPEPRGFLALGLLWGACVATAAALLIGGIGGLVVGFTEEQALAVVAPVTEEASKGLFLLLLLWWRRDELDGVLDGIVYAGMVGIGFAFTENIVYLAAAYNGTDGLGPGGAAGITGTFVLRCVMSPFAHPLFTAFIGIGVGVAVSTRNGTLRLLAPLLGYLAAVTAHALWNGSTLFGTESFLGVYIVLMIPALVSLNVLGVWARRSEARMLQAALDDAAQRGLLPAVDVPWVVDLRARRAARVYAKANGGSRGLAAMRDYQQAVIELGFLHSRLLRGTPPDDFQQRGQQFLARINTVRPTIAFPGQVVPVR